MLRWNKLTFLLLLLTAILALVGCGATASPNRTTAGPTPTTSTTPSAPTTPTPSPAPMPTPPISSPVQWQVAVHGVGSNPAVSGSVSVNTTGDVSVQFSGATPNASFVVNFCMFPASVYQDICLQLATVIADSGGNGVATFRFPQSGRWAGIFRFFDGSTNAFETSGSTKFQSSVMQLEPELSTNPRGTQGSPPQDTGSGTLSVANNVAHIVLTGAMPNATYSISDCYMGGSSCQGDGTMVTDGNGNATVDVTLTAPITAVFTVQRTVLGSPAGFVTGFKVP